MNGFGKVIATTCNSKSNGRCKSAKISNGSTMCKRNNGPNTNMSPLLPSLRLPQSLRRRSLSCLPSLLRPLSLIPCLIFHLGSSQTPLPLLLLLLLWHLRQLPGLVSRDRVRRALLEVVRNPWYSIVAAAHLFPLWARDIFRPTMAPVHLLRLFSHAMLQSSRLHYHSLLRRIASQLTCLPL